MQKLSNSLGLAALVALVGFVGASSATGCGDGGSSTSTGAGGGSGETCGNGVVEGKEACDDKNMVSGDGCEADCTFSCDNKDPATGDAKCNDGNDCNGAETCGDDHACAPGKNADDGTSCGTSKICVAGACTDEACGDGYVNQAMGEECDDKNTANGDGCDACKLSCVSDDPTRDCSNLDPCVGNVCDDTTHTCGGAVAAGDVCAISSICVNDACTAIVCGNNTKELGEACDDGNMVNGDGCQADCTLTPSPTCGNGTRDMGEQCDDSNKANLDGCDATCQFEQLQRVIWLKMQFGTEAPFCPANALGGAISAAAQGQIQTSLDDAVKNGSISILFKMLGLGDLSGTSDPAVDLGVLAAAPVAGAAYDGTKDLDWWYTVNPASIDASRNPLEKLSGYMSGKTLFAGPGNLSLGFNFVGTPATLRMNGAKLTASIGASSAPLASAGTTPGHRAQENLDPALQSFASMGQPDDVNAGKLCGNVSAFSLDQVPVPSALVSGMLKCDQGYTLQSSLLDVIVSGCTVFGFVNVITPTQPDQEDPNAPVAGAGGPYMLTTTGSAVTGCTDVNNQAVTLNTCLNAASYSAFFKIATDRVIGK